MEGYPLFIPPEDLVNKLPKQWNAKEAKEYKSWLLYIIDERIDYLLTRLGFDKNQNIENQLLALGYKVSDLLNSSQFTEKGLKGRSLSSQGYALAADMGLLVAQLLIEKNNGKIYWEILKKPKSEISYNLPVLKGFSVTYLDPVGGSTAEASAILRGQREGDSWKKIYEFWSSKVEK